MFKYHTRVRVPDGRVGYVEARVITSEGPSSRYLVSFRRSEFSPEEWAKISPLNGPSVAEEFEDSDLVVETSPPKIINSFRPTSVPITKVIADAETTMKSHGTKALGPGELKRLTELVTVGSIWTSNRGGYYFKVYDARGDRVFIQGLDNPDFREVNISRFTKGYTRQGSSLDDLDETVRESLEQKRAAMKPSSQPKSSSVAQSTSLVQVGTFWASRRNGDIYEVLTVDGDTVKLSWVGGKYTREVTAETVIRYYNPVERPR